MIYLFFLVMVSFLLSTFSFTVNRITQGGGREGKGLWRTTVEAGMCRGGGEFEIQKEENHPGTSQAADSRVRRSSHIDVG